MSAYTASILKRQHDECVANRQSVLKRLTELNKSVATEKDNCEVLSDLIEDLETAIKREKLL